MQGGHDRHGERTLLLLDWQPLPGSKPYHSLQALNQLSSGPGLSWDHTCPPSGASGPLAGVPHRY